MAGDLVALALRFDKADGGKEFYPLTYCEKGEGGPCEWRWKAPLEPRPIYGADFLAARPEAPVVLCEGEKAADAAGRLLPDHVAVTSWGGSGQAGKANWGTLARRRVVIWPDADDAGRKYALAAARGLKLVSASVSIVAPPEGAPQGWDAADAEADTWDQARAEAFLSEALSPEEFAGLADGGTGPDGGAVQGESGDGANSESGGGRRRTQKDLLTGLVDDVELWHDPEGNAYASFPVAGHWENAAVREREFRIWLTGRYYKEHGAAPGGQALEDALKVLEARALYDGPCHEIYRRVSSLVDGVLYIDLVNHERQAVAVDRSGWRIVETAPIKFIRSQNATPLPVPEVDDSEGGGLAQFRDFINVKSDADWRLLVGWCVGALAPEGPYPILCLQGEQGSAKSTASRLLRDIVDPNRSPLRSLPREERDLAVAARHSHVLAFDNVSGLPGWLSDALCRISTGGGFATRQLHSDAGEIVLDARRPAILNGIPDLASRSDLAERSIVVQLAAIPADQRRSEREIETAWGEAKPYVFGAILDGISAAIRCAGGVVLKRTPRLADFARWATGAEGGLGFTEGSIVDDLWTNRTDAIRVAVEDSDLGRAVEAWANTHVGMDWVELRVPELLERLNEAVSETTRKQRSWPKTTRDLGTGLRRLAPDLRGVGIEAVNDKDSSGNHRVWRFRRLKL